MSELSIHELEQEQGDLLPARETLQTWNISRVRIALANASSDYACVNVNVSHAYTGDITVAVGGNTATAVAGNVTSSGGGMGG